ncbi:Homoserine dehydrogenase [Caenispirillum salinarum AK4]|uniref:Homoserine dehydrogenase n=1 Tax=Caenispirillum salinarum AK4 TaxID=1238182 RepID=K9GQT2_9PROT|nr:Gfo/Idh/MocA family oxidoreductase [Caenispirillum salinarum]EKV27074.1 Homoserine dehydrogenase [Caenispirillum salinarum AK4]
MNLHAMLARRAADSRPVRVALIGAGKFGTMFLASARTTPGLHVMAVADLDPERARQAFSATGWPQGHADANTAAKALRHGTAWVTDDPHAAITAGGVDVVVEATGHPEPGLRHALWCLENGRHVVMVNVEADVLAGPLLARRFTDAGLVYSMAYGDQPALICEMVDWARACGLEVVAAGKGTKYLPDYHASTPDTVWGYYGLTPGQAREGGMNPKMFNSFLDGTKSAIEMAAVSNATGLAVPTAGLDFPPVGCDDLAKRLKPEADGGLLAEAGVVEVVSSLNRDGSAVPRDLRWGVYVTFRANGDYMARCFGEYGMATDESGRYGALYRPYHLIGLELGVSVASAALRGEPTGQCHGFTGDVVCIAKRDLKAGEVLDGEGGETVWGRLMPAEDSVAAGALPIGLAQGVPLTRPVRKGEVVTRAAVTLDRDSLAVRLRHDMESAFAAAPPEDIPGPP